MYFSAAYSNTQLPVLILIEAIFYSLLKLSNQWLLKSADIGQWGYLQSDIAKMVLSLLILLPGKHFLIQPKQVPAAINNEPVHNTHFNT